MLINLDDLADDGEEEPDIPLTAIQRKLNELRLDLTGGDKFDAIREALAQVPSRDPLRIPDIEFSMPPPPPTAEQTEELIDVMQEMLNQQVRAEDGARKAHRREMWAIVILGVAGLIVGILALL